jgi:hypothetical protein
LAGRGAVEVSSSLPIEEVRRRLAEGLMSTRGAVTASFPGDDYVGVAGRLDEDYDEVELYAVGGRRNLWGSVQGVRNSWGPVLHGQLVSTVHGCVLAGRLGIASSTRSFLAVWFGVCGLMLLCSAGSGANVASAGDLKSGAAIFIVVFILLALMNAFLVFTVASTARSGRAEAEYLREWLAERLHSAE